MIILFSQEYLTNNIIEIYTYKCNKRKDTHYTETLNGYISNITNKGFLIFNQNKLGPFTNLKYLIQKNFIYDSLSVDYKQKLFILSPLDRHYLLM